jgi:hypothetical protein
MIAMWGSIATKVIVRLNAKNFLVFNGKSLEFVHIFSSLVQDGKVVPTSMCICFPKVDCQSFGLSHFILPFFFSLASVLVVEKIPKLNLIVFSCSS